MTEISDKEINSGYLLDSPFQTANMLNYTVFSLSRDPLCHNLWGKLLCHGAFREKSIKTLLGKILIDHALIFKNFKFALFRAILLIINLSHL